MHSLLQKYDLITDQISREELDVVLTYASHSLHIDGDIAEFGCYKGTTSVFLSRLIQNTSKKLYVYDSFEGLPEKSLHDQSPAGFAFQQGELKASKKEFMMQYRRLHLPLPVITKGWFQELSSKNLPQHLSFAFLDGDYYDSIYQSLCLVWPQLSQRGFVLVHDYGRQTLPGSKKAVTHFLAHTNNANLVHIRQHIAILQRL